jgi:hypothetical protein
VQQSRKGAKTLSFKTKQFTLLVVVPESQWREYEAWLEQVEEVSNFPLLDYVVDAYVSL